MQLFGPRFKLRAFAEANAKTHAKEHVTKLATYEYSLLRRQAAKSQVQDDEPPTEPPTANDADEDDDLRVGAFFDKILETSQPAGTTTASAVIEIQRYLEEQLIDRAEDP